MTKSTLVIGVPAAADPGRPPLVMDQWCETVRPIHLEFVEPSKRCADLIIPEGGFITVALDLVISRIEQVLHGSP